MTKKTKVSLLIIKLQCQICTHSNDCFVQFLSELIKDPGRQKILPNPKDSSAIPPEIPYLLIGGGTAAFSAFRAIKSSDPQAKVVKS